MFLTYVFEEDKYGYDIEYEYELTSGEIEEAVRYILKDYTRDELIDLIIDEVDLRKCFEEEITDYFREDAKESYFYEKEGRYYE